MKMGFHIPWLGMGRYHIFADMPISTSADTDTAGKSSFSVLEYRQHFLIADTDTADTEKCADMPILPILILVSAHPYPRPHQINYCSRDIYDRGLPNWIGAWLWTAIIDYCFGPSLPWFTIACNDISWKTTIGNELHFKFSANAWRWDSASSQQEPNLCTFLN